MDEFKSRFWAWYDAHFSAGWYKKSSIYAAATGLLLPGLLMGGQYVIDNLLSLTQAAGLTFWETFCVQLFFAAVVVPLFAALKQSSVRAAVLEQAAKTGEITSEVGTEAIEVKVAGRPAAVVETRVDPS